MNRKNSLRSIDWWSFHSYATSPSRASPEERKLNYGKRVCTPGSATSNGYISRTKHRHRGLPILSNVLRSSPSFKTIPSSIGSEFALGCSRNGQTERQRERETERERETNCLRPRGKNEACLIAKRRHFESIKRGQDRMRLESSCHFCVMHFFCRVIPHADVISNICT